VSAGAPGRPSRGDRRLPWKTGEYLVLDFETTGLDFNRDRVISFGAFPIRGGRVEVGEARYQLVDPGGREPSHGSVVVHRIRPVDLVGAPSQEAMKAELAEALDLRYLVAWEARVEVGFLARIFQIPARKLLRTTIDVRDLVVVLEGEPVRALSLTEAATRFGVPVSDPHHALDDALVTGQLFLVAAARLARREGPVSVGDLLRARRRPRRG